MAKRCVAGALAFVALALGGNQAARGFDRQVSDASLLQLISLTTSSQPPRNYSPIPRQSDLQQWLCGYRACDEGANQCPYRCVCVIRPGARIGYCSG